MVEGLESQTPNPEVAGSKPTSGENLQRLFAFLIFGVSTSVNLGSIHR